MPRARIAQHRFSMGEASPLMAGGSDLDIYRLLSARALNWRVLNQGGLQTRPGTRFVAAMPGPARLRDFVFSEDQRYTLAFSAGRMDGWTIDGAPITPITGAPWTVDMIPTLRIVVAGDTLLLFHPDLPPQRVRRTGALTFALDAMPIERQAFRRYAAPGITLTPSATTGSITLTASAAVFDAQHVGTEFVLDGRRVSITGVSSATSATATVIETLFGAQEVTVATGEGIAFDVGDVVVGSARQARGEVRAVAGDVLTIKLLSLSRFAATDIITGPRGESKVQSVSGENPLFTTDWAEQAWSALRGWPRSAEFFDNRLVIGGARSAPTGVWMSQIGAFFNFDIGTALDDEAIATGIDANRVVEIRHVVPAERLLFFTDAGLWLMPQSDTAALTPRTVRFRRFSEVGVSARADPALFDGGVLFVDHTEAVVRHAVWADTEQSYLADAVSLLSEHLIRRPVQMATYGGAFGSPEQLAVLVNDDGTLAVFHSIRAERMAAWVPWETAGEVLSVAGVGDELFLAVERDATVFLERVAPEAEPLDAAAAVTSPSPTSTFTGFSHLIGREVALMSRGHYLGTAVVQAGGTITLPEAALEVDLLEAGLAFTPIWTPMPADLQMQDGPARGLMKRLIRVIVQVDRSGFYRIDGTDILLDFVGDDVATPAPPHTGLISTRVFGVSVEAQFNLIVPVPQKVTLLGVTREVQING